MKTITFTFYILLCGFCISECPGCNLEHGKCKEFQSDYKICECFPEFTTYPRDSLDQCNYQRKKQWIAFILETIVAFGAGHFYTESYSKAIVKLIVWIIAWTLFAMMRLYSVKREIEDSMALVYALWSFIFCLIIIVWYISDVVMLGLNRYDDGNGIEMIYWL